MCCCKGSIRIKFTFTMGIMLDFTVKRTILEQNLVQLYFKCSVREDSWRIQNVLKEENKYGLQESLYERYVSVLYLVLIAVLRWPRIFKITTVSFEK